jgi:hypothetical protein
MPSLELHAISDDCQEIGNRAVTGSIFSTTEKIGRRKSKDSDSRQLGPG